MTDPSIWEEWREINRQWQRLEHQQREWFRATSDLTPVLKLAADAVTELDCWCGYWGTCTKCALQNVLPGA